jgi:hypothetical protein
MNDDRTTNVQTTTSVIMAISESTKAALSEEAYEWACEPMLLADKRMAKLTREEYYQVLEDLYRKLNPQVASGLIRGVRESELPVVWLDRAIVVNQALLKTSRQQPTSVSVESAGSTGKSAG